jgi:tripartite-type tricarboxylate transporter receptor subunit TctC
LRDFTPIGLVNNFGFFLVVNDSVPAKTAAELLDYARSHPGKLNYGTGNTTAILATAQLKQHYGLNLVHIPYKGDAPAVTDLVAGRVEMMFVTGTALPFVKAGRLRALATMLASRSPLLPEVPTMEEAGIASVSITPWGGLVGPANLPPEIVTRIARELKPILATAQVRDDLARLALEARSSTPEEMAAVIRDQLDIYRKTVDEVGMQRD